MSILSPVVDSWEGETRRIYLKQGVTAFHWLDDIYKEYRLWRRGDDAQKWAPFLQAKGNEPKGGGKYTPRYVIMIGGARVVPYDEESLIIVSGEAITDNPEVDPSPFDTTDRTEAIKLYIELPTSEVIRVTTGGVDFTPSDIATAVVDKIITGHNIAGSVALILQGINQKIDDNIALTIAK